MFRKIILTMLACLSIFFPVSVSGEDGISLTWSNLKKAGINTDGDVIIPDTVVMDGKERMVTKIGQCAFEGNEDVTSVIIPDTVTSIGMCAFNGCTNLKTVVIPKNLKSIGSGVFQLCTSLEDIAYPDTVTSIGNFALNHCTGYMGSSFTLPASLETVGTANRYITHMFYDFGTDGFKEFQIDSSNQNFIVEDGILYTAEGILVSIPRGKDMEVYEMPDWVTGLGELSFSRNMNIKKIVLSDNLEIMPDVEDDDLYYNCHANTLAAAEYGYTDVGEYEAKATNKRYASEDGILYAKDMRMLVAVPNHYKGEIDIPEGTVAWQDDTLWGELFGYGFPEEILSGVTAIHIPATMTYIPDGQIDTINDMVRLYGIVVTVASGNTEYFVASSGYLAAADADVRYTKTAVHMRSEPNGEIKETVSAGTMVVVTEMENGWAKTEEGYWCLEKYLE